MDLKDFTDLGNDIGRRVNDAINNRNFDQLNRDVRNKVERAFRGYGGPAGNRDFGGLDGKLYHGEEPDNRRTYRADAVYGSSGPVPVREAGIPVISKLPGNVSSVVMMILGYGMTSIFGAVVILLAGFSLVDGSVPGVPQGIIAVIAGSFVPFLAAGIVLAVAGTKRYGLVRRFRQYLSVLQGRTFCAIKDFEKKVPKSRGFIAKDLKKMIQKGYFPEGHLDDQQTCFIGTDEMYRQYLQARDNAAQQKDSAATNPEPEKESHYGEDIRQVIAEGEAYIKAIREANDAIYNAEISEKLYRMETVVKKIFDYVKENPDQVGQLRRFMSYYMPTTEKLVNAYRQMDQQSVQGPNITKAKAEIAQTLDTINEAYEKLYDSMYADVAMDVSSDIAVLKSLFAQEGLSGNAMNGGKKDE